MKIICPQPVVKRPSLNAIKNKLIRLFKRSSDIFIGPFRFSNDDNHFVYQNQQYSVQPKVLQLAYLLKAQQGKVVTRETIEATLWPREVVGVDSVNNTISRLRRLLGDTPKIPTYIETITRRGYRLKKRPDYRLLRIKKPEMILKTITTFLILISLPTALRYTPTPPQTLLSSAVPKQNKQPTLHRDPKMQQAMLASNITFQKLIEKYDVVLLSKK